MPGIIVAERTIHIGDPVVVEGPSTETQFSAVFEDDGTTGYFYGLDMSIAANPILDALHIYDVQLMEDPHEPREVQIVWTPDGLRTALLIDNVVHAMFDFEKQRACCRTGQPPPTTPWTRGDHVFDRALMAPFKGGLTPAPRTGIERLSFDTVGFKLAEDMAHRRVWVTDPADSIAIEYFPEPDPMPVDTRVVSQVREFARQMAQANGGGIVEADPVRIVGVTGMRSIYKYAQEPQGFVYTGGFAFHVGGHGYSVSVECFEVGITGQRETLVAQKLGLDTGRGLVGRLLGSKKKSFWKDPYTGATDASVLCNVSDDASYDTEFPNHPLSRVRRHLDRISKSIRLA